MSILIPNRNLPNNCYECPMRDHVGCWATLRMFSQTTNLAVRQSDCPLIELPKHGRLIDADKLIQRCRDYPYGYRGMIECTIYNMPTIIEAEKGEENGEA